MLLGVLASFAAVFGAFGPFLSAMATFVALATAFATAPLIAWATHGRYYLARKPRAAWARVTSLQCAICEHAFEPEDMAYCPVYSGPICSLCCSLDARCKDGCRPHAHLASQVHTVCAAVLPQAVMQAAGRPLGRFAGVFAVFTASVGLVLLGIHARTAGSDPAAFWQAFFVLVVIGGIAAWLLVLAQESRRVAEAETQRQTSLLMSEIRAHRRTDAALQRARDVAETASLAKSHFVTSINHELRSPLNAILGYAQLLERDPAAIERRTDALRIIRRSGEHLAALVEGLLDISRIEAKRIDIFRHEVLLPEFLNQLVDMFRLQAEDKGLDFAFDRPEYLPDRVYTDEHRLRQILINLLSNAIKFTAEGSVTLRIRWRTEITEFEVIDTGIGIAADQIERIFEPLHRVKAPLTSGGQVPTGLGLGLPTAQMVTETLGGELTATSMPDQGSRFRVRLMLSPATCAAVPARIERQAVGYEGRRRTVLVADDDPSHRMLLADLLTPLGFSVIAAANGAECLALSGRQAVDIYLVDLSMPGMTGWELARRLRERAPVTPIIIVSADGWELKQPPGEATHHDDTLTKPISLVGLLERMGRLLQLDWHTQDTPAAAPASPGTRLGLEQVERLREYAAIGYVNGLRTQLDALEREAPEAHAHIAHLRELLAEYRLEAFLGALDAAEAVRL